MYGGIVPNYEFLEKWTEKDFEEFISTPSALPYELMGIVAEFFPRTNIRRAYEHEKHPELEHMDLEEGIITRRLVKEDRVKEAIDYHIKHALNFLEKYPQYKPMIKEVKECI